MDILKRNNVKVSGKGQQAIIFAHGFGCDQNMWRFVSPAFENEYKIILFDHVGSGKSDSSAYSPVKYNNLQAYADDILEICSELQINNIIFVGHSVSSMIGMLASIKEPSRFEKLVMVGPSPCYINDKDYKGGFSRKDIEGLLDSMETNYLGWSSTMAPVIMGNPNQPELSQELANSFCSNDPDIARQFAKVTFLSDNRADLAKFTTPCLILQCSEDVIAPLEVGYYLAKNIINNKFVIMNATGHCPNLSAPEETIGAIKEFLAI